MSVTDSPYSTVDDMLIGDVRTTLDKSKFVTDAADEIDSKLGVIYKLPLENMAAHEVLLLKSINNRLASGRFILAAYTAGEVNSIHQYGRSLIQEALADLMLIANGDYDLSADKTDTPTAPGYKLPETTTYDDESLLLGFENTVMAGKPWFSRPGADPTWL